MRKHNGKKLIGLVVIIIVCLFLSISPISGINLGLDLQGGAQVRLQAVSYDGEAVTDEDMQQLTAVMRKRVDTFGIAEPLIQREGGDRLLVELAGVNDPEAAIELIGRTALLEFREPSGAVILTGEDLVDAKAEIYNGANQISLEFNESGREKFANATSRLVGSVIDIYLDNERISGGTVRTPILNGQAVIEGGFPEYQDAVDIAALLKGGALPVQIEILSKQTVGPTLGQDSLQKSLIATAIGMGVLFAFMIVYYRLPGLIANLSLIVYALILLWVLKLIGATLTLPGIAGFVLSVGMAVDANIIIYERIREELSVGKSLRASINHGFKRAFWTIFDSNLTTLLAAIVLYIFGTGPIQGFALTLSIGLMASMLTAITFTRGVLSLVSGIKLLNAKSLYARIRRG